MSKLKHLYEAARLFREAILKHGELPGYVASLRSTLNEIHRLGG